MAASASIGFVTKNGSMLYDDGRIGCSDTSLVVRRYYPWGTAKKIPYSSIRSVTRRPLSGPTGEWRIWGSDDFVHWWNFDPGRPKKEFALEIDIGRRILPTITPDDPEIVERILNDQRNR
jgi:hypothetical protein